MTLLDVIMKALGQAASQIGNVKAILASIVTKFPDTAAELNPIIAALDAPVTPESLAALGAQIPGELLNIAVGKINPKTHSGDAI